MNLRMRPTVRLRLALLFGGLFLVASVLLLALTYGLLNRALAPEDAPDPDNVEVQSGDQDSSGEDIFEARSEERAEALREVLNQSIVALLLTSGGALLLGWVMAGRVLRPIRKITTHARRASEATLSERIGLRGPPDELKELADTIDAMLARLEKAFAAQRQFSAQASHELRTPITIIRAEADVALAAPDATPRERRLAEAVRGAADRSERLVDGLLALARSESTLRDDTPIDLAELVGDVVGDQARAADAARISVALALEAAPVVGDRMLLNRLVGNLVENAIQHNRSGGWMRVSVITAGHAAELTVSNSGAVLGADTVETLFEPFRRGILNRRDRSGGFGLGLAIVRSVAAAHGGSVGVNARVEGGLVVTVRLPIAAPRPQSHP